MGDLVLVSSEHIILGPIGDLFKDMLHTVQLLLELLMSRCYVESVTSPCLVLCV